MTDAIICQTVINQIPVKAVNAESRRNQLMRDMAQLRLQAEVSQLEGSLEIDQPIFPPYLVAHTSVLCDALPYLKQLTQTARCIIIIPLAVIDILDFLKKTSAKAREAIRWLELEFRHGNRYIRAQKCNERLSLTGDSNLKKTNRDVWCLVEIVDCCQYLAQQSGDFSHSGVTTVLISNDLNTCDGSNFIKDMQNKGQCQDISFEKITDFVSKWKGIWKSKG
ncbi:nonsense-mediated mRNA decay factor SMG5 [Octopus bimaculoides]|uniref:nonsense-mediated mRNA decay factor SMG5 n=1 Tax=Octopus bimaculoides TaxID=37653 RepID=UPI0022E57C01|nr:nonsense-mediated mRNA decay factor SMG5 [Octopus bimaculoides]